MNLNSKKFLRQPLLKQTFPFWLLVCCSAGAITEEHLTKNFSVQPGGTLIVEVDMGSVSVSTNAGNEVAIDASRKIGRKNKADEEAYIRDHPIEFTQEGNTIKVVCRAKGKNNFWNFSGPSRNEAKYVITVPAKFNARLNTSGGSVSVSDLAGEVKAGSSAGSLKFARLQGPLVGKTSGGSIDLVDCNGKLEVESSAGGIKSHGGSGSLNAHTSGGSVQVKNFRGPADLGSSAGGITLEDVVGEIAAETSGGGIKATLPAPLAGPVKLSTSAGGVTVHVPAKTAFALDAQTSAGSATSELPVTIAGKMPSGRLKGSVNGGGPAMVLRSSGGSIHVLKAEPVLAEDPK